MRLNPFFLVVFILFGCQKTKLIDEYSVLEGKWKWVSAMESKESISTGFTTYNEIDAENYSESYYFEFSRSGHVYFLKENDLIEKYRTRVKVFSDNCNLFPSCLMFIIRLDNKKDQSMMLNANSDSLHCLSRHAHLPLQWHSDNTHRYTYTYKFVKIN